MLRVVILAISLIVAGLRPAGMVCEGPGDPSASTASQCGHASHHQAARLVAGGECSISAQALLLPREEARRAASQPVLGPATPSIAPAPYAGGSTHPAASNASRLHQGWRGSPLVLRI